MDLFRKNTLNHRFYFKGKIYNRFSKSHIINFKSYKSVRKFRGVKSHPSLPSVVHHNYYRVTEPHKFREEYYLNNKLHRDNGPAVIEYYNSEPSPISSEHYYRNGKLHRFDGPAKIHYNRIGERWNTEYYIHGQSLDQSSFVIFLMSIAFCAIIYG